MLNLLWIRISLDSWYLGFTVLNKETSHDQHDYHHLGRMSGVQRLPLKRWERPKPCWCNGYWFPHRIKSGSCIHNPNYVNMIRILAKRYGLTNDEEWELIMEYSFNGHGIPANDKCPF